MRLKILRLLVLRNRGSEKQRTQTEESVPAGQELWTVVKQFVYHEGEWIEIHESPLTGGENRIKSIESAHAEEDKWSEIHELALAGDGNWTEIEGMIEDGKWIVVEGLARAENCIEMGVVLVVECTRTEIDKSVENEGAAWTETDDLA